MKNYNKLIKSNLFKSRFYSTKDVAQEFTAIPEHFYGRKAIIYKPAKTAMQSGSGRTKNFVLEFSKREKWQNPLMGWE